MTIRSPRVAFHPSLFAFAALARARRRASEGNEAVGLGGIDAFVEATMAEWKVPGLALAVVKEGRVVHMEGYGFRDRERKLPVTPQDALPHRLDLEVVHGDRPGDARRREEARLGPARPRGRARVPAQGPGRLRPRHDVATW